MKCLSVFNPWAVLLITGARRFETRSWFTHYRGRLAIHASGRFPTAARDLCFQEPIRGLLRRAGFDGWTPLPSGVILGTVELVRCMRADELLPEEARELAPTQVRLGDWAWELRNPVRYDVPLVRPGRPGLFNYEENISTPIRATGESPCSASPPFASASSVTSGSGPATWSPTS